MSNDRCMRRQAAETRPMPKTSAGISVFLLEELGDARMRCVQLKDYIAEATNLIEKSEQRDHIYEVAGHLLYGIPNCLLKMEKALDATALAAARLDYEEIKNTLRPEKVEELERALEDVRIRQLKRRGSDETVVRNLQTPTHHHTVLTSETAEGLVVQANSVTPIVAGTSNTARVPEKDHTPMTPKQATEQLFKIAASLEQNGRLPIALMYGLINALEAGPQRKLASKENRAAHLRGLAQRLGSMGSEGKTPSRLKLAAHLRTLLAEEAEVAAVQQAAAIYEQASSRKDVIDGFRDANPNMTNEELNHAADMWEKHKNVVKDKQATEKQAAHGDPVWINARYPGVDDEGKPFKRGDRVLYWPRTKTFQTGAKAEKAYKDFSAEIADEAVYNGHYASEEPVARFQEGKPADPTENMSPADAQEWKDMTDEHKDNFKESTTTPVADQALQARFEEGKPADPTQNMDKDDASEWKDNTEEHKDEFKQASSADSWKV